MKPSQPATEHSPQARTSWARPKVITVLLVLLAAYWVDANWADIKAGARDSWADTRMR